MITKEKALESIIEILPEGIGVQGHSDLSEDGYPDLEFKPLKREVGAQSILNNLIKNGMEVE